MPPKPKHGLTANEVKYSLSKLFPAPEWLSVEEVHIKGFDRYIDFWCMRISTPGHWNYYPDKGFEFLSIHAIEIKVSHSDFLNELKKPEKRLGGELFSNYFSFAAPRGIIELDEIPEGIGYIEIQGMKPKIIRLADYTRDEPIDKAFLAAVWRAFLR